MKVTKRLIGAVIALVAALAVSVGATFAWFTSQNTAKVSQFEVSVRDATGNLYIGTSAETVSAAPLDVSGEAGVTGVVLKDLTLSEDGSKLQDKVGSDASDGYVHFTLYFQATTDVDVYLLKSSEIKNGTNAKHHAIPVDAAAQSAIGDNYGSTVSGTLETNAANAARVMFGKDDEKIWAPNEAVDADNTGTVGKGFWKNNLAADYEQYLSSGSWSVTSQPFTTAASKVKTVAESSATEPDEATMICELSKSGDVYTGSVEVWIWLEGTDGDCLNSIFNDVIQVNFDFIGLAAGAGA